MTKLVKEKESKDSNSSNNATRTERKDVEALKARIKSMDIDEVAKARILAIGPKTAVPYDTQDPEFRDLSLSELGALHRELTAKAKVLRRQMKRKRTDITSALNESLVSAQIYMDNCKQMLGAIQPS